MKVVFISGMLPAGHYSQYITNGLNQQPDVELIVYADQNPKNLEIKNCGQIKLVWSKSFWFFREIWKELKKDKPEVIHLQHELNMYGGGITALIFPWLAIFLRLAGYRVVITVHAAVYKKQVDQEFIKLFHQESVSPFVLKLFFHYIYKIISLAAHEIIVHTNLTRDILTKDYGVKAFKVHVIPIAIPQKPIDNTHKEQYFFYFGYMVRRKGLGYALDGFKRFIEENPQTPFKLVMAGGVIKGQEQAFEEIKQMIEVNNLQDKVIIKGFIETEAEQDELYYKAYAVVIPAKITMGSSGPLFHCNSYGKCVIATREGHFIEDIEHLKTGILTENDKWHEAFKLAAEQPALVSQIEENVKQKAKQRSPIITAQQYLEIYKQK